MGSDVRDDDGELAAGDFARWLADMEGVVRGVHGSAVACGSCTACCTSSQFIHIAPHETDTLAHVPGALLFPAPGLPRGHVLLGYDEEGHCPMLIENRCSIYEHRPMTCRTYDCRVFPAAAVDVDADGGHDHTSLIGRQARRWRFSFATRDGRVRRDAVQAAAAYLRENPQVLTGAGVPNNPTQLAVSAIEVHGSFLRREDDDTMHVADPDPHEVRVALTRRRRVTG